MMDRRLVVVKAAYDHDAAVWFVEHSDVEGLNIEAATVEDLLAKLPGAIADLLEENEEGGDFGGMPIELIAHASARVSNSGVA